MVEGDGEVFLTQLEAEAFATRGAQNRSSGYGKNHGNSYGLLGGAIAHVRLSVGATGSAFGLTEGGAVIASITLSAEAHGIVAQMGTAEAAPIITAEAEGETDLPDEFIVSGSVDAALSAEGEASGVVGVSGDADATLSVLAEGEGTAPEPEVETPATPPVFGFGYRRYNPEEWEDDEPKKKKRKRPAPVVGSGEATLSLRAKATGEHHAPVKGSASIALVVNAHVDGVCERGHFEEDNAFFMWAA